MMARPCSRTRSFLPRLAAFVVAHAVAGAASAQTPRSLTIPGSPRALAASIGLDGAAVERPRYMLEMVRHVWGEGAFRQPLPFDRLVLQVKGLQRIQQAWFEARGRDNAIGLADARSSRKVYEFLHLLGVGLMESKRDKRLVAVLDETPIGIQARDAIAGAGFDIPAAVASLNRGNRLSFSLPSFTVPLPLDAGTWTRRILQKRVEPEWIFAAILADRSASLLYYGLLSLDPETLAFVAGQPRLVDVLARDHAAVFAVYGRSIHVRDGCVAVPGGESPEVVKLWEHLVGRTITEPASFIDRLLGTADGRLAYLYDIVQHLDPAHGRFVLGARPPARVPPFAPALIQPLLDVLSQPDASLDIPRRPFIRPAVDLFVIVASAAVTEEGELAEPSNPALWAQVFGDVDANVPLTVAGLARLLLVREMAERQARLRLFLFAQRVLGSRSDDPRVVVQALKGYGLFQPMYAALERMGVRAASTYSAAALVASRVSATRDPDVANQTLSEFQAALALLDRCVFTGRLAPDAAKRLVDRLLELKIDPEGSYGGSMSAWLLTGLLPALSPPASASADDQSRERVLLEALAGVRPGGKPVPVFTWRDAEYQFDPGEADYRRLEQVRAKQGGNSLDRLLDLAVRVAGVRSATRSIESDRQAMQALLGIVEKLAEPPAAAIGRRTPGVKTTAALISKSLQDLQPGRELRGLEGAAAAVERLSELLLANTLRSIVYAVYIADPDTPLLLDGDMSALHSFGTTLPGAEQRMGTAWLPVAGGGSPWRGRGSLLALDRALWEASFRGISNEPPSGTTEMMEEDRAGFAQTVTLFNPYAVQEDDARQIAQGIDRGRKRVEGTLKDGRALQALAAEAGLGEWATATLPWAAELDRDSARGAFGLWHLLRLGRGTGGDGQAAMPAGLADRWGTSHVWLSGLPRLGEAPPGGWESYAWRWNTPYLSMHVPDLQLHVAQWLAQMKLPAALARDILPAAILDFRDGVRLANWNDCRAAVRYAGDYPENRFSDLVSNLADKGVLALYGRR